MEALPRCRPTVQGRMGERYDLESKAPMKAVAFNRSHWGVEMANNQRVNIFDVANQAGVAPSTVSRVLNGSSKVSDSTRARVQLAIELLDFRPSRIASGLSKGRVANVAIVAPYLTRPSVVARVDGALEVFDKRGYQTVLYSAGTPSQATEYIERLMDRHEALGVMVISLPLTESQLLGFRKAGVELSLVDSYANSVVNVHIDNVRGGWLAADHLIKVGHRRIGIVGDIDNNFHKFRSSQERIYGFTKRLLDEGISLDSSLIRIGKHSPIEGRRMAEELLVRKAPPTALFATSDTHAIGILAALESLGFSAPDDCAVVGFDDLEVARLLDLSTVRQPLITSGTLGAERLCDLLEGKSPEPKGLKLDLELVARASTMGKVGVVLGSK